MVYLLIMKSEGLHSYAYQVFCFAQDIGIQIGSMYACRLLYWLLSRRKHGFVKKSRNALRLNALSFPTAVTVCSIV